VAAAVTEVRTLVPPLTIDRLMTGDLAAVRSLVATGRLREAVEAVTGPLG
jgi:histidine ammonia-lyase